MKLSDVLSDESKWTQGAMARLADGRVTSALDENATLFCLAGGMIKIAKDDKIPWDKLYEFVKQALSGHLVSIWNDEPERTWEEVAEVVKKVDQWIEEREGV